MITSKGCPSKCGFCHVGNIPYTCRKAEDVVSEIEECFRKYKIREIEFFDPVFTLDRDRVMNICRQLRKRNIKVSWACRARVDQIDNELLKAMKLSGCKRIYYGIECGNQSILNTVNKGITLEQIRKIINLTKKNGILTLGFFIIGGPRETAKTVDDTIKFSLSLNLDYAQFHKAVAKPTTILYDELREKTKEDYWKEFILGNVSERHLLTPWTDLTGEQIEQFTIKAYHKFYFRPRQLIRIILGIRSFHEFRRYLRSFIGLFSVKSDLI
jgi:radical SAM superfamily enzyme YgiQ (UPF0313 family)